MQTFSFAQCAEKLFLIDFRIMSTFEKKALLAAITFIGIILLFALYIFGYVIIQFYCKESKWINATYKHLTTITIMLCLFSIIGDGLHLFIKFMYFPNRSLEDTKENILESVVDGFWFFGCITFYILILLKISVPFQLNNCIYRMLIVLIIIFGITAINYCTFNILIPTNKHFQYFVFIFPVLSLSDLVLNITILIIFRSKMKETIVDIDPRLSIKSEHSVNFVENTITKHCVLFGIAIITNQAYYAGFLGFVLGDWNNVAVSYSAPYSLRTMECMIKILILWLSLRISYDKYIKLCKCCHLGAVRCCTRNEKSSSSLDNPYHQLQNL